MPRIVSLVCVVLLASVACAPAASPQPSPAKPAATAAPAPTQAAAKPAATAAPAASTPAAKAAPNAQFQKVLEEAKKEAATNTLMLWPSTPKDERTHRQLFERFEKRFDLKVKWEWTPIGSDQANTRFVTEAKTGIRTADLVAGSEQATTPAIEGKFVDKYDWVGVFGGELPAVKESADRVIEAYRGYLLTNYDIVYGLAWNTKMVSKDQVPTSYEQWLDPKWSGKIAVNGADGAPFGLVAQVWGEEKTMDFARKLKANKVLLKSGSPAAVSAVVAGEVPLTSGTLSTVCSQAKSGAPIQWRPMEVVPALSNNIYVPNTSKSPNLARLFAAWMVSEGAPIIEDLECAGRITDTNSQTYKTVKEAAPSASILRAKSLEDVAKQTKIEKDITTKIYTSA